MADRKRNVNRLYLAALTARDEYLSLAQELLDRIADPEERIELVAYLARLGVAESVREANIKAFRADVSKATPAPPIEVKAS